VSGETTSHYSPLASEGEESNGRNELQGLRDQGRRPVHRRPAGPQSEREKEIGQHIGYRYDVNLLPDYSRLTPFLKSYMEYMGWDDLNWLEDVHMGYEEGEPAIFDRNINGWVRIPKSVKLPKNQQDRDMIARELLIRFQMSPSHPLIELNQAYRKF
jgi:hypothetical protein